jgi:uncharacterized protein (DUF1330 family)
MFDRKTLLTATTSIVLGAGIVLGIQASIGPLHAQSTPAGTTVSEINVKDMDAFKAWLPDEQKRIADHGGKYIAGGFNKTTSLTGDAPPNRVVVIHWPSVDAVKKYWQEAVEADQNKAEKFASFRVYVVEGVEQK